MQVIGIATELIKLKPQLSIYSWIERSLSKESARLQEGDILVISSKVLSYFEGRVVNLESIKVHKRAKNIAERMSASEKLIQLVLNEADEVIAETPWVLLTRKNGIICANAGIDTSNVPKGHAVLWPEHSFQSAEVIRKNIMNKYKVKKLSIIIADSTCLPGRKGTIAIAIGYSGIKGIKDLKNSSDLYKNKLRYSAHNIVDSLATSANLVMGESLDRVPLAIVRNYSWQNASTTKNDEMIISSSEEMFPLN